ncbi:hypothetical protein [Streptomyces sp. PSKA30]|uniref:hypothetical protein n=1 Tax=Streptomyces sp. PSKA30 TaxID=2874597 RepID=UPI001CD04B83|nr:hypothetical protein [Streptomyces sp. PSKA30]MBZ9638818.1 hypothetical protein [Streptomyces sp. PSKA30]
MTRATSTKPVPDWLRDPLSHWDVDALTERIAAVDAEGAFPDRHGDSPFFELLRGSVSENLRKMRQYLLGTVDLEALDLQEPLRFARKQAEIGSSQDALQQSYRLGITPREGGAAPVVRVLEQLVAIEQLAVTTLIVPKDPSKEDLLAIRDAHILLTGGPSRS